MKTKKEAPNHDYGADEKEAKEKKIYAESGFYCNGDTILDGQGNTYRREEYPNSVIYRRDDK